MPDGFRSIRSWDGSKDRAFEEICYQLLREPEDLPPGMVGRPIRTGNPDGGVEWYTLTADGKQWGWQAKYIDDVNDLLDAMTSSVRRVVTERPQLTKLTFCISANLPASTRGRQRKSARQRYEEKKQFWQTEIAGAENIDFDLIQGSDLLDRLALPKHAGRAWFWWNELYLGQDWLANLLSQQAQVAGDRYRPVLQVDLPIQDDLSALGFAESYFDDLNRHARLALERLSEISVPGGTLGAKVVSSARRAIEMAEQFVSVVRSASYQAELTEPLEDLDLAVAGCISAIREAQDQTLRAERPASDQPEGEGRPSTSELLRAHSYHLSRAANALSTLKDFLNGLASRAVRERFYFLTGAAGTGKTHLCLDSVQRALNEQRPALVVFGGQLGAGDLWSSICDQLGLPNLGADKLLGALEAVAEASGLHGRRFVFMVDALNDTKTEDYWVVRLPTLQASFASRPLLSLLVSCRDTYLDYVDPENRCRKYRRTHPGFAGREVEATHKYFQHYELSEPKIPLLLPEFTVPLFLLTYCEGLKGEGLREPPPGHEGRIEIFERFLDVELKRVTRRLGLAPGSDKVRTALDALLDEMSATGTEYVPFGRAEELALGLLPERTEWPRTALGALLSEGLLNEERVYDGDKRARVVRVTYQAFSDFLILLRRLQAIPEGARPDVPFAGWLGEASWGIREAAAVLLPERHDVELPDLLEPLVRQQTSDSGNSRQVLQELDNLDELTVRSLPYRRPQAITERSIQILNRHTRTVNGVKELFDVTFLCAPQPHSPLNGHSLDKNLSGYSMARRDAIFGKALYHDIWDESSPLSRLAR